MNVHLIVFTDGRRECLERTLESAEASIGGITTRMIVDDSGDVDHWRWLDSRYAGPYRVHHNKHRLGFAGAIQTGWAHVPGTAEYVFHLEDDFTFNEPVDLQRMAGVLDRRPTLVQLALKRQPWSPPEVEAGGFMEMWPDLYQERHDAGDVWTEQRLFFTTNPSLYRASLTSLGWPDAPRSEQAFTEKVLAAATRSATAFGYWGGKTDPPRVTHIGKQRIGTGY